MDHQLTPTGKNLDLSFLQKPHEHDPRRVYSTTATDWQARVDFDRLRKDRLARARTMMEKHDLGALVCFVGENVRYITERLPGQLEEQHLHPLLRAARGGEPVLFETAGSDLECAKIDAPWLNGHIRPAITWKWAETAEQMMADKMAHSIVRGAAARTASRRSRSGSTSTTRRPRPRSSGPALNTVSAWPAMSGARVVKTPDELECLKISSRDRRHVVLEDRARVAEAGRQGELHHRQGERVPLRAGLRLRLRHHRRVGRQHEPVPPLAHRQGDPRGRPRDRRPERRRPGRLLRRLRPLLQGRRQAGPRRRRISTRSATSPCTPRSSR